ncbi:MAG: hypothetical protein HOP03_04805 [Lysobacter sp.]|nr:hypothetical protein [Lysobacter sp.]
MPVKWKSQKKFNPDVVLARVGKNRMTDGEGTSFSGFEVNEDAATLHSMLDFPDIASEMDKPSLVWKALVKARPELTAATFIEAINIELTSILRKKEEPFCFLSTISFDAAKWPKRISILDTKVDLYGLSFPKKFAS